MAEATKNKNLLLKIVFRQRAAPRSALKKAVSLLVAITHQIPLTASHSHMQVFSGSKLFFLQSDSKNLFKSIEKIRSFRNWAKGYSKNRRPYKKVGKWPSSIRSPQASILILNLLLNSKMVLEWLSCSWQPFLWNGVYIEFLCKCVRDTSPTKKVQICIRERTLTDRNLYCT